jgi:beta-galactosidase
MNKQEPSVTSVTSTAFKLDDREQFLYSGEMHYFRVPRRFWAKHLAALREAGCQVVSSYIPWSWHEPKEGEYDFTGKTHPERDIKGFVREAAAQGLKVTLKPGPYALAELTDQGMPFWVTRTYPETRALDENGNPWGDAFISYYSPKFREIATKWLRKVCRQVLLPAQKKGQLVMIQLCNEIGMFHWLRGGGDYSQAGIRAWHDYLRETYPDVQQLADLLDINLADHTQAPPPKGYCNTRRAFILNDLWHSFHRWLYADYVDFLMVLFDDIGIRVPRFNNVGGWVHGRAHELPLNGTFQHIAAQRHKDVLFGIDHIPEFVTATNVHDAVVANQVCMELQHRNGPLFSAEFQCGSREFGVEPYPGELALFYRLSIAHGLTGMNFYMFSQGKNPKGVGMDGPLFYHYNAVDWKGRKQPVFPIVKQLGEWLQQNGEQVVHSRKPADLGIAFYAEQHKTEFFTPILHKVNRINYYESGFTIDRNALRDGCWFDSLLRSINRQSIDYDLPDLQLRDTRNLSDYKKLVVSCDDVMDAQTQQKLVDYVKNGGQLILFPMLPVFDPEFNHCTLMQDAFGMRRGTHASANRISMNGLRDLPAAYGPFETIADEAEVIAVDADKRAVGIQKKFGKGTVRFFGFFLGYSIKEHPAMWEHMIGYDDIRRNAWADTTYLHTAARMTNSQALLFVGNFHRMTVSGSVFVNLPDRKAPLELGPIELPAQTGLLLPVNYTITDDITLDYAHAELYDVEAGREQVILTFCGAAHTQNHVQFSSKTPITAATVDGLPIKFTTNGNTTRMVYEQSGQKQYLEIDLPA